jgi:hypothetical protein
MTQNEETSEKLLSISRLIRKAIEPGLARGMDGRPQSQGSCLHASLLLKHSLEKFDLAKSAVIRGGGDEDQGILGSDCFWYGHYWIEATAKNDTKWILDITADQFGHAPVVVVPLDQAKNSYRPGPQEEVDAAASVLSLELGI